MQFYVQTDSESRITDVIDYPHEGYTPVDLAAPLPPGIIGGSYQLVNGSAVYRPEWDNQSLMRRMDESDMAIAELSMTIGGMLNV